ncbi:DUF547 domain containing protein [Nitzschia inconspicua]|uniref:DUF547 domain containing protein n=1 Tax=Nitzschia inconspicua TaxID=303405 RepID=A0A9K3KXT5_9STRA|nr:DUF547 domain containing protein [Nitzschia inconspicua]
MASSVGSTAPYDTPVSPTGNFSSKAAFGTRQRATASLTESSNINNHGNQIHRVQQQQQQQQQSSHGSSTASQIRVQNGRLTVETTRQSSITSDDTMDVPKIPPLPASGSLSEPVTPTLQYASADTYPPVDSTPTTTGNPSLQQHNSGSKKDTKSKSSSLLASSRKAGSKVVKATVVRPARAVTRVFRNSSKPVSDESGPLQSTSSGIGEEVETIMARGVEGHQVLLHSAATSNGVAVYGTMNGSVGGMDLPIPNLGRGISGNSLHSHRSFVQETAATAAVKTKSSDWPVHSMEALTRQLVLVCVAYVIGANYPEHLQGVLRTTEFAVTAWFTCVAILCLSFLQRRFPHILLTERDRYNLMMAAGAMIDDHEAISISNNMETTPLMRGGLGHNQCPPMRGKKEDVLLSEQVKNDSPLGQAFLVPLAQESPSANHTVTQDETSVTSQLTEDLVHPKMEHPSLVPFYVIDAYSGERVLCNSATPHHISTEWFEMDMLCLIRTCDADDSNAISGTPANDKVSNYMRSKARRFEFQFRVKLKKTPVGKQVYFACELDEPIKMGIVTRAFVGAAMAFMKKTNPTFHYSITGSKETPDGLWEKPHMSFTVEGSLDRLVVTKPNEKPPKLGQAINESPESIKRRKKGVLTDWNTEDTYTMALWSSYVDFLDWNVLNLPGIRPFGLSSVLGTQAINLTMYLIDEKRDSDKHFRKNITEIVKLELSNEIMAACGPFANSWKRAHTQRQNTPLVHPARPKVGRERSVSEDSGVRSHDVDVESNAIEEESAMDLDLKIPQSTDEVMEEIEEVDEDVLTAAELGEGIYLRSGDSVVLREFRSDYESIPSCSVANGGGFAVLQERDVAVVVEKAKRSRTNKLIKSGDTVIFKMIQNKPGSDDVETRYLTIHRGWWLKWVTTMPTKNGFFTIFTHETELGDKAVPTGETQSSFLTLGGSFTLRHKRWSKYCVGIAAEPSSTYGGRMMGLYNPKSINPGPTDEAKQHAGYHSEEEFDMEKEAPTVGNAGWLKPLVLRALDASSVVDPGGPRSSPRAGSIGAEDDTPDLSFVSPATKLIFSSEHSKADVPAWIEMMDRVERVRQLAYVVRVTHRAPNGENKLEENDNGVEVSRHEEPHPKGSFMRLRTGRELAHVMSVGQSVNLTPCTTKQLTPNGSFDAVDDREILREPDETHSPVCKHSDASQAETNSPLRRMLRHSYTGGMTSSAMESKADLMKRRLTADHAAHLSFDDYNEVEELVVDSFQEEFNRDDDMMDEFYAEDDSSLSESGSSDDEQDKRGALEKGKKLLGKSAKLAKKTVVGTGKLTAKTAKGTTKFAARTGKKTGQLASSVAKKSVRQSKKVVKGTVKTGISITKNTGKALIAPVTRKSSKPPKSEPKKKKEKEDSHVEVSKRMRNLEKIEEKTARPPTFIAGELCAPEQSCRTASRVLSRMSNLAFMSSQWEKCNNVLSAEVEYVADHDQWFLNGNYVDLGVVPIKGDGTRGELLEESLVARCHWESHWREEWCGMYESCVSFYAPLSKSPCLDIAYMDITDVRPLESDIQSPLPGLPLLVLETAWLCHYIAFRDGEARDTFGERLEQAIECHVKLVEETASLEQSALRKARFWQGFQTLSESSLTSGVGKWAKLRSKDKTMERAVLNGRRMAFDCRTTLLEDVSKCGVFVRDLLTRALSFSLESLEQDPDSFIEFLDLTSQLKFLPLDEIDLSGKYAFCLFVNIYHCLLQQALLLSVNGPLTKKNITHFMRTSCYEIGGDVFSLAELQCCVIRGKLSKPVAPKPPYIEPPKKSNAYRYYALGFTDCQVHFVLSTGDTACPVSIPVLSPATVDEQLIESCAAFLDNNQLIVDTRKRAVTLPKVCEVYKHDFGNGDSLSILKFCVRGMDADTKNFVRSLLMDEKNLTIKFQNTPDQYHSSLRLRESVGILEPNMSGIREATSKSTETEI